MQRHFIITLVALMVAAPAASATWYSYGTYEPDTARDNADGYMQKAADPAEPGAAVDGKKLYFNAYPTEQTGVIGAGLNHNINSGTLGTRILVPGFRQYAAVLGNWVDCNQDGYLGIAESALSVYPSAALSDTSVCPDNSAHHDNGWVWEYIAVGANNDEVPQNLHPVQIIDNDAKIWGDFGLPGAGPAQTCPIIPLPHGTTTGTGRLLRYADCFDGKQVAKTVNTVDADGSLGLRFQDENHPERSTSLLNQDAPQSLFGNPDTQETGALQLDSEEDGGNEESAFTAWDCSSRAASVHDDQNMEQVVGPATIGTRKISIDDDGELSGDYGQIDSNLTDSDGNYAWVASPASNPNVDPTKSFADGVNGTVRGFHTGGDEDDYSIFGAGNDPTFGGTCSETGNDQSGDNTYSGIHQTAFFYPDGEHEGNTQVAGKNKADIDFRYSNGAQQDGPVGQALGTWIPGNVVQNPHGWQSNTVYSTVPQSVNRNDPLNIPGGAYLSFYAKVGASTLALGYKTTGSSAKYGAEACGSQTSGIHNKWECAPSAWNKDTDPAVAHWSPVVGETYQFRDIDCDDGTVARGSGVHASLVDLSTSGAPCVDSPI